MRSIQKLSILFTFLTVLITSCQTIPINSNKVDSYLNSTVLIECKGSYGSGVILDRGAIATARHVIDQCEADELFVHWPGSEGMVVYTVHSIYKDHNNDVALLKIGILGIEKFGLPIDISNKKTNVGDEVVVLGFPAGYTSLTVTPLAIFGRISGLQKEWIKNPRLQLVQNQKEQLIVLDANINNGMSGGPVISLDSGEVIGILTQKISPDHDKLMEEIVNLSDSQNNNLKQILHRLLYYRNVGIGFAIPSKYIPNLSNLPLKPMPLMPRIPHHSGP